MEIRRNTDCLESEQEFLHCCFKVIDKQITLAKVSLFVNPYHLIEGVQACAIGHFTCVNDQKIFDLLLDEVVKEVKMLGHRMVIGPMNGSTWNEYRLLTSEEQGPFLLDVVTPRYHIDLYKNYGFEILEEYISTLAEQIVDHWDVIEPIYNRFRREGIRFEGFDIENSEQEFRQLAKLCFDAFAENFLYSPISEDRFVEKMKASLALINPRYTWLAKKDDQTVGFIFCYPDKSDKDGKTVVVKTLARASGKEFQGLGSVLSALAMKHAKVDGYTKGIHALMVISNSSTYISRKFKAKNIRNYALMSLRIK